MADIRVHRHNHEVLAAALPLAHVTRMAAEVLHDQQPEAGAQIQVHRHNHEVLAEVPPASKVTRMAAEVVHDLEPDPAAGIQVHRHNHEVLGESIAVAKVTRMAAEVVHDLEPDPAACIQVHRHNHEVLARSSVSIDACELPQFWRFFGHNFLDEFILDTRYNTAISRSALSLAEDRTLKWQRPRRTASFRWSEKGPEDKRNLMDLMQTLRSSKTNDWVVPLACDEACLTQDALLGATVVEGDFTKRRFFIGARVALVARVGAGFDVQTAAGDVQVHTAVIVGKESETRFILDDPLPFAVSAGRATLTPLICVHPRMQDTLRKHHGTLWDVELEFEEKGGPTCLPSVADELPEGFDVYRGLPILRPRHDYSNPLNIEIFQEGQQVSLGRDLATFARGEDRVKHSIRMFEDRDKGWDYVQFFESRRGRNRAFWLIDQEDLFEVLDIETNFIDVRALGDFTEFQKQMQFFGFMMMDGTCYVREIITFNDLGGTWRLSVGDPLPLGLSFQDVCLSGRGRYTRMLEDTMRERWAHTDAVRFDVKTISLPDEKDVTLDP